MIDDGGISSVLPVQYAGCEQTPMNHCQYTTIHEKHGNGVIEASKNVDRVEALGDTKKNERIRRDLFGLTIDGKYNGLCCNVDACKYVLSKSNVGAEIREIIECWIHIDESCWIALQIISTYLPCFPTRAVLTREVQYLLATACSLAHHPRTPSPLAYRPPNRFQCLQCRYTYERERTTWRVW